MSDFAYRATADGRVMITWQGRTVTTLKGDAGIECCGQVDFWPQAKHAASAAPH